jgi:hypothetical protein
VEKVYDQESRIRSHFPKGNMERRIAKMRGGTSGAHNENATDEIRWTEMIGRSRNGECWICGVECDAAHSAIEADDYRGGLT